MSRYRPPRTPSAPYITRHGAENLKAELDRLWKVERPKVTDAVTEAAKNGDRSENGDYIYGKRRLREIDARVRYLTKRLETITVIAQPPPDQSRIFFGASVTLKSEQDSVQQIHIVGADEIDLKMGKISIDSPLARAILGKSAGDSVEFVAPRGLELKQVERVDYALLNSAEESTR